MSEKYYENCRAIFVNYGLKNQKKQFIQELAELIQAITKNDFENFAEELADVQVMIDQFITFNPDLDKLYKQIRREKVERQLKRIREEK